MKQPVVMRAFRPLSFLALSLLAALGLTWAALHRLHIETDIVRAMPAGDPVMEDALAVFANHPMHDRIAVDIALDAAPDGHGRLDELVALAEGLEERMRTSGLFAEVGNRDMSALMPALLARLPGRLPVLFTAGELEQDIAPRLEESAVAARITALARELAGMEGIGQADFAASDPLNLRETVLARLAPLAPTQNAQFHRGHLLSRDGRHLLLLARPCLPGSDTHQARALAAFFTAAGEALRTQSGAILTPMGAWRAALDNEEVVRRDVEQALLLSTAGIALLLFLTFPRPFLGLLSLLPSLAGTAAALFVYSLFRSSISMLVLGFGGALIAITVDYGITYLLLLDRAHETRGREAARELRAIGGKPAMLTTVTAFLVLGLSGFPMFAELGLFTALGFLGTYAYVMLVFPRMFPTLPPGPDRPLPLRNLVRWLGRLGKPGAIFAALLFCCLLPFAKPVFHISLQDMSSVRESTRADETRFAAVWGDMGSRAYLMTRAENPQDLQAANDRLLRLLEEDRRAGAIADFFSPALLFPGPERAAANLTAWRAFWTPDRRAALAEHLASAGEAAGFAPNAFAPFLALLDPAYAPPETGLPETSLPLLHMLGVHRAADGSLVQFIGLPPGPSYDAAALFARYSGQARVFDGPLFAARLGDLLFTAFVRGLVVIVALVACFHVLFSLSPRLTALTLLPSTFAFVCTLGTLQLMGHPLNLPALMLAIVIFGMGDDYAVYTVYGYQRHRDGEHPSCLLARTTVFMAAASSLIGLGALLFAEHPLLKSVGLTSVLGVGYSLLGAFLLLPALLRLLFHGKQTPPAGATLLQRVLWRYRLLEAYPRVFARCKLGFDPMFRDLPGLLAEAGAGQGSVRAVYDIGCGYGVPACWFLEHFPESRVYGIDPDPERVRAAALAAGERGDMRCGSAVDAAACAGPVDLVLMLDMLHYLDDDALHAALDQAHAVLAPGGLLLLRHAQPPRPESGPGWFWRLEDRRVRFAGHQTHYRDPEHIAAFFAAPAWTVLVNRLTEGDHELAWLLCRKQ